MICKLPRRMSKKSWFAWKKNPLRLNASLPNYWNGKMPKYIDLIVSGKSSKVPIKDLNKWKRHPKRFMPLYCENPTAKNRIQLRNWGFALTKAKNEKNNIKAKD